MQSPRYGEHMALPWLEAARYADTDGYQNDRYRYQHVWRDWVIQAFNDNMPYDQFVIEQLAGDMLPECHVDAAGRHGFWTQSPHQLRRRFDPGRMADRERGRPRRHVWHGLSGTDDRLCPLPRSQVRSDFAAGVLPAFCLLQQHRRMGRRSEQRQQSALHRGSQELAGSFAGTKTD